VAVGSIGEASKAMSAIASHLVSINAPVRFKVVDTGTALRAANAFAAGKVNLAVVRGDVGDLSQAGGGSQHASLAAAGVPRCSMRLTRSITSRLLIC
jgi:TRAP-type uncharacterized transport system substrate-binding protein